MEGMKKVVLSLALCCALLMSACWQKDVGRSFYPSGKVRTEATVRNGLLDGPSTMF
jgi:antitoxin component YwqK of YwqJK toxin-antitoxin module